MSVTFNVYRSDEPMDLDNMPVAIATGLTDKNYSDNSVIKGEQYYYRIGAVRTGIEKIGDEIEVLAGTLWTPENLTNPAKIWLDSYDESSISIASGLVNSWNNKGTLGGNFSQQTTVSKPSYSISKTIDFDGVNDLLVGSAQTLNISRNINKIWYFAVAAKRSTANTSYQITEISTSGATTLSGVFAKSTTEYWGVAGRRSASDSVQVLRDSYISTDTYQHCLFASIDYLNATALVTRDGAVPATSSFLTSGSTENVTAARVVIGSNAALTAWSHISINSIIVGSGSLPTVLERQKLEGWAAHKYGLTGNLPNDHPYKENPPVIQE